MSFWTFLFGTPTPPARRAYETMQRLNPNCLSSQENEQEVFIEDYSDPDGRMYRLEYQCDPNGDQVTAICRYNPWGQNPYSAHQSHLFEDGRICLGTQAYNLADAVQRARYWCTAYSYLREHGSFPSPT